MSNEKILMRNPKFRAWNKTCGGYINADTLFLGGNGSLFYYDQWGKLNNVTEHYDMELYTNYNDKNNNSIYKGDIIALANTYSNIMFKGEVMMDGQGSWVVQSETGKVEYLNDICNNVLYDIGLIEYENNATILGNKHETIKED